MGKEGSAHPHLPLWRKSGDRQSKFGFFAVIHESLLYKACMRRPARSKGSRIQGAGDRTGAVRGLQASGGCARCDPSLP